MTALSYALTFLAGAGFGVSALLAYAYLILRKADGKEWGL